MVSSLKQANQIATIPAALLMFVLRGVLLNSQHIIRRGDVGEQGKGNRSNPNYFKKPSAT